jgi:hypothetical protein
MDFEDRRYSTFLDERARLIEAEWKQSTQQDKYILTMSAGVYSVSIAFLDKIAPHPVCRCMLIGAWWVFAITILCTMLSFSLSQSAARKERALLDKAYQTNTENVPRINRISDAVKVMNYISIALFFIAITLLTTFISINFY